MHTKLCKYDACNNQCVNVKNGMDTNPIDSTCTLHTNTADLSTEVEDIKSDTNMFTLPDICSLDSAYTYLSSFWTELQKVLSPIHVSDQKK